MSVRLLTAIVVFGVTAAVAVRPAGATSPQATTPPPTAPAAAQPQGTPPAGLPQVAAADTPAGYVIGPDDVLAVLFWREKDMSVESATVRPDGMISLPLLNDVAAAGLTPDQLRAKVAEGAAKFLEDPNVTVVVRQINSRKVFVTGQVGKPGPYPLAGPTNVLQLIAIAGGLLEFAKGDDILIMRPEGGKTTTLKFKYKDVVKGKNLQQNIELKPGDTIVVP